MTRSRSRPGRDRASASREDRAAASPLGPSAVSPIVSTLNRFRDEYEAYLADAEPVSTTVPVQITPREAAGV